MKTCIKILVASVFALLFAHESLAFIGPSGQSNASSADGSWVQREQHYILVANESGGTVTDGSIMVLSTSSDDGFRVTTTTSGGLPAVCVMAESCTSNSICKCQTYGYHSALLFDTVGANANATAGQCFYTSANAGKARGITAGSFAADTVHPECLGVFLDSKTSIDTVEAFIQLQ